MKKILILTAGFGEGHNAAARGVRDGIARVAPTAQVEMRDPIAETYRRLNYLVRKAYLSLINHWPRSWGYVYRWLDCKSDFDSDFERFSRLKNHLRRLLDRFQPDIVVSTFPPYPYLLGQIGGSDRGCRNIVVITDSITVNAIWYGSRADYFLVPNEQSADVVRTGGVAPEKIKIFGFPVSPKFAEGEVDRPSLPASEPRVLYVINAGTRRARELVRQLRRLDIQLTVTVGRDVKLRRAIQAAGGHSPIEVIGWTDELPRLLRASHLLIGKAGGAMVQEAIAASCPMIINHVVSGQEEGNARLIAESNCGAIALSPAQVVAQLQSAFQEGARQWREWESNIRRMSRPRASLDIAEFLLSI